MPSLTPEASVTSWTLEDPDPVAVFNDRSHQGYHIYPQHRGHAIMDTRALQYQYRRDYSVHIKCHGHHSQGYHGYLVITVSRPSWTLQSWATRGLMDVLDIMNIVDITHIIVKFGTYRVRSTLNSPPFWKVVSRSGTNSSGSATPVFFFPPTYEMKPRSQRRNSAAKHLGQRPFSIISWGRKY